MAHLRTLYLPIFICNQTQLHFIIIIRENRDLPLPSTVIPIPLLQRPWNSAKDKTTGS